MSKFFDSEIVREELKEINQLQESIYGALFSFSGMSRESQVEHIDMLVDLLERQKVMYTRLSLRWSRSKTNEDDLKKSIMVMGFPDGTDMPIFWNMHEQIQTLRLAVVNKFLCYTIKMNTKSN